MKSLQSLRSLQIWGEGVRCNASVFYPGANAANKCCKATARSGVTLPQGTPARGRPPTPRSRSAALKWHRAGPAQPHLHRARPRSPSSCPRATGTSPHAYLWGPHPARGQREVPPQLRHPAPGSRPRPRLQAPPPGPPPVRPTPNPAPCEGPARGAGPAPPIIGAISPRAPPKSRGGASVHSAPPLAR